LTDTDTECQAGDNFGGGGLLSTNLVPSKNFRGLARGFSPTTIPDFYKVKQLEFSSARSQVFRYALFAEGFDPDHTEGPGGSCGDQIDNDTDGKRDCADPKCLCYSGGEAEIGGNDLILFNQGPETFMHELGHTLGLGHGGRNLDGTPDYRNCKPNYVSVMNYDHSFGILQMPTSFQPMHDGNGNGILDERVVLDFSPIRYDDASFRRTRTLGGSPQLLETSLNEAIAIDPADSNNSTAFVVNNPAGNFLFPRVSMLGVDFDGDMIPDGYDFSADGLISGAVADIDRRDDANVRSSACSFNNGLSAAPMLWHDDWGSIEIGVRRWGDTEDGPINVEPSIEPTDAELQQLRTTVNTADLSLTLAGPESPILPGDPFVFDVVVANAGPYPGDVIEVNITLPENTILMDSTAPCLQLSVNEFRCSLPSVDVDSEAVFTVTLDAGIDISTTRELFAEVKHLAGPEVDDADNDASLLITVCPPPVFESFAPSLTALSCQAVILGQPVATSECGIAVTLSNDAPAQFPIGTTVVAWTATDALGSAVSTTQLVTVHLGDDVSCCDDDQDGLCSTEVIYFSPTDDVTLDGLSVANEDIVRFDETTNTYSLYFDGSDVGVGNQNLDAFSLRADGSILMSFDADSFNLAGVGTVREQDIVRFVPTSTGSSTAGSFQSFFVGSSHGLGASSADVSGLYEASDGTLYISLRTGLTVSGLAIADEDVVRFNPATNDYSMIFDGSDVGLGWQAIDAFNFQQNGSVMVSLRDYPEQNGLPGLPAGPVHNVFRFAPAIYPDSYGPSTSGSFHPFFVAALNEAPTSFNLDGFYRGRTVAQSVFAAELAMSGGGSVLETSNGSYVGGGYINSSASGGFIEFLHVDGGTGGSRTLRIRNALGVAAARTGRLVVNGVAQDITFSPTGSWTTWTLTDVAVQLSSGPTNTIRLESNGEDLANIDQIELLQPAPAVPNYQAEAAAFGGGAAAESTYSGFIGTGYVNSPADNGFIEFRNVDGGAGGTRTLTFSSALGVAGSRSGRLVVNGAAQTISFPSTGAWSTWTEHDVSVSLTSGTTNTIRLESTGQDLANIDQLEVH
jgi:hypothetical protein